MSLPPSSPKSTAGPYQYGPATTVHRERNVVQFAQQLTGPGAPRAVAIKSANLTDGWPAGADPHAAIRHEHDVLAHLAAVAGVPRVVELIEKPDGPVLVQSKIEGVSLHQGWANTVAGLPANWRRRITALPALARLLLAIRAHGWSQGDLTPKHVLVRTGELSLVDFGHARPLASPLTRFLGTPPWFVPELMPRPPLATPPPACEAFVFGLMLHLALTGKDVYPARALTDFNRQRWATTRAADEALPPDISTELRALVHGLVEPDPARRRPLDERAIDVLERELASHRRRLFHHPTTLNILWELTRVPLRSFILDTGGIAGLSFSARSDAPDRLEAEAVGDQLVLRPVGPPAGGCVIVRVAAHEETFLVDEHVITVKRRS